MTAEVPLSRTQAQQAALAELALSLIQRFDSDQAQAFAGASKAPAFQEAVAAVRALSPAEFGRVLATPLTHLVDTLVKAELPGKPQAQFLFAHGDFVMRHVRQLVEGFEGFSCCADKARSIIQLMAVRSAGKDQAEFNRSPQAAYRFPTVILTTGQACEDFLKALHLLFNGHPQGYIQALDGMYRARAASRTAEA